MSENRLIIAAAGSGKTTHLIKQALSIKKDNVLITTFTDTNEQVIKEKILEKRKYIPSNITVQTWFSFLLQHGVRPYQGIMNKDLHDKKIGFYLIEGKSGLKGYIEEKPIYWGESDFEKYYFTRNFRIYSDKIAKFVFECNKKMENEIINRLTRIYQHIFIDEIQDLAGWDLELLKLLFNSPSSIIMVGDPRQATYSTNDSTKHRKYRKGKIADFIKEKCPSGVCDIDTESLNRSHRNNEAICHFSSNLYPEHIKCEPCECQACRAHCSDHQGVFRIKEEDINAYCEKYKPVTKLYYQGAKAPDFNYGLSKGLSFDRVLIYPTRKIIKFLKGGNVEEIETIKAKFYVAVTRARYSVAIVCNEDIMLDGVENFKMESSVHRNSVNVGWVEAV